MSRILLSVRDLVTWFKMQKGEVKAVDGISFDVFEGETLCVVGESGSGKSAAARSILQIVDPPGRVVGGQVLLHRNSGATDPDTVDILSLNPKSAAIRAIRGRDIAMIFQEPMSSLSPVHKIGDQVGEAIRLHEHVSKKEARERAVELLRKVEIPNPGSAIDRYTFEFSGGMRQRAMIAMALACNPSVLIADEPTTNLDVTIQLQYLNLLKDLQRASGVALIFVTHNLGIVAKMCDKVAVMYAGKIVEMQPVRELFYSPRHPYTKALLDSMPKLGSKEPLYAIPGQPPDLSALPPGCSFHPRCTHALDRCQTAEPEDHYLDNGSTFRCWQPLQEAKRA